MAQVNFEKLYKDITGDIMPEKFPDYFMYAIQNGFLNKNNDKHEIQKPDKRAEIVLYRYQGHTLKETGEKFGLGQERVRQITTHFLRICRHPARMRMFREGIIEIKMIPASYKYHEDIFAPIVGMPELVAAGRLNTRTFSIIGRYLNINACGDILKLSDDEFLDLIERLRNIRGAGPKTINEVIKLRESIVNANTSKE